MTNISSKLMHLLVKNIFGNSKWNRTWKRNITDNRPWESSICKLCLKDTQSNNVKLPQGSLADELFSNVYLLMFLNIHYRLVINLFI